MQADRRNGQPRPRTPQRERTAREPLSQTEHLLDNSVTRSAPSAPLHPEEKPPGTDQRSSWSSLSFTAAHSSASGSASLRSTIGFHSLASSALSSMKCCWSAGTSSSAKIASAGHSATHNVQSMHSSGSMTRKLGPSRKQSTGQTSTQSVYLQRIQFSVTT